MTIATWTPWIKAFTLRCLLSRWVALDDYLGKSKLLHYVCDELDNDDTRFVHSGRFMLVFWSLIEAKIDACLLSTRLATRMCWALLKEWCWCLPVVHVGCFWLTDRMLC
jgi:hypothetical protein